MNLICIGVDHHANSVEARERLSLGGDSLESTLRFFGVHRSFAEMVILSTCNRVEFYLATRMTTRQAVAELKDSLKDFLEIRDTGLDKGYIHRNEEAIRHLFEVCSGLQSMVIGETEIFGQAKEAYLMAKRTGSSGPVLNRLFQTAFNAAKAVRTASAVGRGHISVASVSVQAAIRILGSLKGKHVLVLGAGDTGEKVTEALYGAGVRSLFCTNRRAERGLSLSEAYQASFIPWEAWKGRLCSMDILICSTSAPHAVLERGDLAVFASRFVRQPLLIMDLAVPRDVDPAVAQIPGVCLLNVDDLKQVASENLSDRLKERTRALEILEPRAEKLVQLFYKNDILHRDEPVRVSRNRKTARSNS
ncbi:MAG: glutamyl-tRNA reductase [Candidatus Methylacidiphilales bacterium]|nr:glutamyl-tRNA reductase [Candidatus Methylacidiphilales bacterium]